MKCFLFATALFMSTFVMSQPKTTPTLKSILLSQLKSTHNEKDWFVPINVALEGVTAEQANWKDSSGNHSVGQLVDHLVFWNGQQLAKMKGQTPEAFNGNNNETFNFDKKNWEAAVKKIDNILKEMETLVENADEAKLNSWASAIAHISTHNAYHTGQIIFVRKLQGSWDPEKGVK